jgi:hypothetical protein
MAVRPIPAGPGMKRGMRYSRSCTGRERVDGESRTDTGSAPANDRKVRAVAAAQYRLAQAWAHLDTRDHPIFLPPNLVRLLNDGVLNTFRALPAADQAHLIAVAIQLAEAGWDDEIVTAGLVHDIGKAVSGIRITVVDRGLWVILKRVLPSWANSLADRTTQPRFGVGMWALARHAGTGASMLAAAGCNHRVCWLVRHHECRDIDDPGLRALIAADDARQPVVRAAAS